MTTIKERIKNATTIAEQHALAALEAISNVLDKAHKDRDFESAIEQVDAILTGFENPPQYSFGASLPPGKK